MSAGPTCHASRSPGARPIRFLIEVQAVTGDEGKALRMEQARAIQAILRRLQTKPAPGGR